MKRTIATLATASLLVIGTPAVVSASGPEWRDCGPQGLQCGTIDVPVGDRKITLNLARLPATGTRQGAVLYAPGGPGKDGVKQLQDATGVLAGLREHFDVVAFQTRHERVMDDLPAGCSTAEPPLMVEPRDRAEFDRQAAVHRAAFEKCAAGDRTGLFTAADSASVARDMDAVRAALGERRINVMAESYGGIIAAAYARQFPHRIRAMHLDGTPDHSAMDEPGYNAKANERMLDRFAAWCAGDASCALHGEDAREAWLDLVRRVDRSSPPLGDGRLTGFLLQSVATGPLGNTRPGLWQAFADMIVKARGGDFTAFGEQALGLSYQLSQPRNVATWCGDGLGFGSYEQYAKARETLRETAPGFGRAGLLMGLACSGWPYRPANPPGPIPVDKLPPLLGSGTWTDYDMTSGLTRRVAGSVTIRYDGPGHVLYVTGTSRCVAEHAERYFTRLRLPAPGTVCPPG
jgi:pimeloyl-ACP methyl ester carboxylesterase